jgi:hypothetical protein
MRHIRSIRRHGHSLFELVTAMASGVVLLAGLGAVMMIGSQIAYTPSMSTHSLAASRVVSDLADELRFATMIVQHIDEQVVQVLEFVVSDRDGSGRAQRIRYDWPLHPDPNQREPDDPPQLYKTRNGKTWPVAEDISVEEIEDKEDIPFRFVLAPQSQPDQPFSYAVVSLQSGEKKYTRVDSAIPLLNRPRLLAGYWRIDFDAGIDPTTLDVNGDGIDDWLSDASSLRTNPDNDFNNVTVVEGRYHNPIEPGDGPLVKIHAVWGLLQLKVNHESDGSQTLTLFNDSSGDLQVVKNLWSEEPVTFRLTIRAGTATLHVNGEDVGQLFGPPPVYDVMSLSSANRYVEISNDASAEFDYVEVRVAED